MASRIATVREWLGTFGGGSGMCNVGTELETNSNMVSEWKSDRITLTICQ